MSTAPTLRTALCGTLLLSCNAQQPNVDPAEAQSRPEVLLSNSIEPPAPVYRIEPFDLRSSADPTALEVVVAHNAGEAPDAVVDELEKAVSLMRWPSGRDVPFVAKRRVRSGQQPESAITLVPSVEMGEGWYAIGVASSVTKSTPIAGLEQVRGMSVSRFRVGSAFFFSSATLAAKSDGATVLYLDYSEKSRVADVPARGLYVEDDSGDLGCTGPDWRPHSDALRVTLRCNSAVFHRRSAKRIVVNPGIRNERGQQLPPGMITLGLGFADAEAAKGNGVRAGVWVKKILPPELQ